MKNLKPSRNIENDSRCSHCMNLRGATENAGLEYAGLENTGPENAEQNVSDF